MPEASGWTPEETNGQQSEQRIRLCRVRIMCILNQGIDTVLSSSATGIHDVAADVMKVSFGLRMGLLMGRAKGQRRNASELADLRRQRGEIESVLFVMALIVT